MGYRGKVREQEEARRLRAAGYTMPEIAAQLGVSRSSVSLWTRDVDFTPRRPRQPPRQTRPNVLQRRKQAEIDEMLALGREQIGELSDRDLLIAGTALYAGDGSKRDGCVSFANSNPAFVALFCRWLRRFFDINEARLRVRLYLHEELDLAAAIEHWAAVTGVPAGQFGKPYRAKADSTIRRTKHQFGCAHVDYNCAATHRRVMGLITALTCSEAPPATAQTPEPPPMTGYTSSHLPG